MIRRYTDLRGCYPPGSSLQLWRITPLIWYSASCNNCSVIIQPWVQGSSSKIVGSPITVLCFYCWMCKSKWETSVSWKLYYRKVWIERLLCFRIGFFLESHVTLHNWSRDAFYLPQYCLSSFKRQEAKIQLFPHRIVHFLLGLYKCYSSASFSCCRSKGLDKKPA